MGFLASLWLTATTDSNNHPLMEVLPHIQISSVGFYMSLAELVLALCVELQHPRAPCARMAKNRRSGKVDLGVKLTSRSHIKTWGCASLQTSGMHIPNV